MKLETTQMSQIKKINKAAKKLPGIAGLVRCIEENGVGVEQEVIDYSGVRVN
jgi:hypothetical protein